MFDGIGNGYAVATGPGDRKEAAGMISHEHARRLAEIECNLVASDPKFVARMHRRQARGRSRLVRVLVGWCRAVRAAFLRSGGHDELHL